MLNSLCTVAAVVVSAGTGQRLGADKTFLDLGGKPVIAWSLDILQGSGAINSIVLVLHKNSLDRGKKLVTERGWSKVIAVCEGGRLRQDSVRNGLERVKHSQYVLVHDGARPFLTNKLIDDGIEAVRQTGAAVAAVPVKDTVKEVDEAGLVTKTPERGVLRMVQTPQVFRLDILREAYESIKGEYTDDSAIVEQAGYKVKLYFGDYGNIKITTREDLVFAEMIAKQG
jgi:2-C-methyl-D-erythritol 4-phosphate cytidylyltransferase